MRADFKLPLADVDWSFIEKGAVMKKGNAVCDTFIDGFLYPLALGDNLTMN
jgi:hypothetical protein